MESINLAKIFLDTMPPSANAVQEEIKFILEEYSDKINHQILCSPQFNERAITVSSMIVELRAEVYQKIFDEIMKN